VTLSLIPFTAPIVMVIRVMATDVPFFQVALGAILLAATAILVTILVARLFRAQSLLSGSKPTLKQVFAALK